MRRDTIINNIKVFQENFPSIESYWRSIILFGRNVASYKFALAKSLLEIAPTGRTEITLEELAIPFSKNLCVHLKHSPKQNTNNSSQFLDICKSYNAGTVSYDELIETTVKKGFNNVIDAFHIVNNESLPVEFYSKDYSDKKKIILTDEIFRLQEIVFFNDFFQEAEARWNLVETAWEMGISRNLLTVQYDEMNNLFFICNDKLRRKDVTSARHALNGYQKGKCFYCFDDITINSNADDLCDVDHFFPYVLQLLLPNVNLNGVWNLVLSCSKCNRGSEGKFTKVPSLKYLERIHKRNEFLISSHHPLRETLLSQVGIRVQDRISFLNNMDKIAINNLSLRWEAKLVEEEIF